jgi:hypothetical protein
VAGIIRLGVNYAKMTLLGDALARREIDRGSSLWIAFAPRVAPSRMERVTRLCDQKAGPFLIEMWKALTADRRHNPLQLLCAYQVLSWLLWNQENILKAWAKSLRTAPVSGRKI